MEIELITIGDEILTGSVINSNVAFISRELIKLGYKIGRHTTLSDDIKIIKEGLQTALARSTLVITTGGLGPTIDDLTRGAAAQLFDSPFHLDLSIVKDLKERFGELPISLEDQATVPSKALVLPNKVGTAPALIFDKRLILLPGVPNEMRTFLTNDILPYLQKHYPVVQSQVQEELYFCQLSESLIDNQLRLLQQKYPQVNIGIYPDLGTVMVQLKSVDSNSLYTFIEELQKEWKSYLLPCSKIETALMNICIQSKQKLIFAESCTGGMMAAKITSQAGASQYFLGSLVVYSNELKQKYLGVSDRTLREKGAVSKEVVSEMLEGLFIHTEADYGIAVSGIAGPDGGSPSKPVGTIWAAMGKKGEIPDLWTFHTQLNREGIILLTTYRLLGALYRKIVFGIAGGE